MIWSIVDVDWVDTVVDDEWFDVDWVDTVVDDHDDRDDNRYVADPVDVDWVVDRLTILLLMMIDDVCDDRYVDEWVDDVVDDPVDVDWVDTVVDDHDDNRYVADPVDDDWVVDRLTILLLMMIDDVCDDRYVDDDWWWYVRDVRLMIWYCWWWFCWWYCYCWSWWWCCWWRMSWWWSCWWWSIDEWIDMLMNRYIMVEMDRKRIKYGSKSIGYYKGYISG